MASTTFLLAYNESCQLNLTARNDKILGHNLQYDRESPDT